MLKSDDLCTKQVGFKMASVGLFLKWGSLETVRSLKNTMLFD